MGLTRFGGLTRAAGLRRRDETVRAYTDPRERSKV